MLNLQRILFPTDLSKNANRAFALAAVLANQHDADLHLLNVSESSDSNASPPFPVPTDTLSDWLEASALPEDQHPDLTALSVIQKQIHAKAAAEQILDYAQRETIDLVVMGTHGRRGLSRFLFGSVTEEVVREAPCPVLTVRTGTKASSRPTVRRILAPVDFSDASKVATRHATEIARTYGAELVLLHVVEEVVYPSAYGVEPSRFPTHEVVNRVKHQLTTMARDEIDYESVTVSTAIGYAPTSILDHVAENDIDLVVIATHGRSGLTRALLGSVAERVIRRASVPVFLVKPDRKSLVPFSAPTRPPSNNDLR